MSERESERVGGGRSGRTASAPRHAPTGVTITIEGQGVTLPRVTERERSRMAALLVELDRAYPDAHCELHFTSAHELLVATILSAQATDVSVNKATPALFARFPTPRDYAMASPSEIEPYIKTIGLFRNKAKAIHTAMTMIVEEFGGEVPRTMGELLRLRGVARKTGNVVMSNAFHTHVGVVVDTHVERLSKRFGLVGANDNVAAIEKKLMALTPRERWGDLSHLLIFHGRRVCRARGVSGTEGGGGCSEHPICARFGEMCELRKKQKEGTKARGTKPRRHEATK